MPVKMRHTYIVIVINNHIIKEILLKSLIGYCKFPCVGDNTPRVSSLIEFDFYILEILYICCIGVIDEGSKYIL